MVLGICSLVFFCACGIGLVPAIVALCLAPGARRDIRASNGALTGEGQVKAGVICSCIGLGLAVIAVVFRLVIFGVDSHFSH
jgi:hypothetical protein